MSAIIINWFDRNDENVLQDLEEVEAWLVHVQQILWAEPQRMFDSEGPLTREVRS